MKRCCNVWQGKRSALCSGLQGLGFRNGFWTGILGLKSNIYSSVLRVRFRTLSGIFWSGIPVYMQFSTFFD